MLAAIRMAVSALARRSRGSAGPSGSELSHSAAHRAKAACAHEQGGHLAKRAEPRTNLFREELRLLPGREVPASVNLVVVDQVGVRAVYPAPRSLVQLLREHGHSGRDRHALGV